MYWDTNFHATVATRVGIPEAFNRVRSDSHMSLAAQSQRDCEWKFFRMPTGCACPRVMVMAAGASARSLSSEAVRHEVCTPYPYTATSPKGGGPHKLLVLPDRPHVGPRPVARGSTIDGLPTQESVFQATSAQGV
jgi:hypothetical protein